MLKSSLKALGGGALCEEAGIDPEARAETIDVAGFLRLAQAALARASSGSAAAS
jgi:16S rRNA (adenine1518-N6/adenine1519-N6)-dimethyltransferase